MCPAARMLTGANFCMKPPARRCSSSYRVDTWRSGRVAERNYVRAIRQITNNVIAVINIICIIVLEEIVRSIGWSVGDRELWVN